MQHPSSPVLGGFSPWGAIDHLQHFGPDAVSVSTPSHGGFWVSPEGQARIAPAYRSTAYSSGGWYEEDCDWCIPYLALGLHAFEECPERGARNRAYALQALARWHSIEAWQLAA